MIPKNEQVPDIFKRNGQNWIDNSERCYKCESFIGNMPMTGRCQKKNEQTIVTGDFCKGDWCPKFELKSEIKEILA